MTTKTQDRLDLIKKIHKQMSESASDGYVQLPVKQADIKDEFVRLNTHLEKTNYNWENEFLKDLIFGS